MNGAARWLDRDDNRSALTWALLTLGAITGAWLGWFAVVAVAVIRFPPVWAGIRRSAQDGHGGGG